MSDRLDCPRCDGETEFVQLGGADCSTVETRPSEVGDNLLELRWCVDCGAGIENILAVDSQTVVSPP